MDMRISCQLCAIIAAMCGFLGCSIYQGSVRTMNDKKIEILWNDLTEVKQQAILDAFGDNCNFEVFPVATIEFCDGETEDVVAGQVLS
jgi:hypothetical protein